MSCDRWYSTALLLDPTGAECAISLLSLDPPALLLCWDIWPSKERVFDEKQVQVMMVENVWFVERTLRVVGAFVRFDGEMHWQGVVN